MILVGSSTIVLFQVVCFVFVSLLTWELNKKDKELMATNRTHQCRGSTNYVLGSKMGLILLCF